MILKPPSFESKAETEKMFNGANEGGREINKMIFKRRLINFSTANRIEMLFLRGEEEMETREF